jgi:hypothetical protein
VSYEENGEGGFTSDLSTSVFDFFSSFFAFLITFFASFLTSFFLCFDFFPFPAIAPSRAARQTTSILTPALQNESGGRDQLIPPLPSRANFDLRLTIQPSIDVFAHHISGETIALLDYTFKLFALSVDLSKIVISELAPLLFDPALSLLPISFDAVPVHFHASENYTPQEKRCDMPGSSARRVNERRVPGKTRAAGSWQQLGSTLC